MFAPIAAAVLLLPALPPTWRSAWEWVATAAESPTVGETLLLLAPAMHILCSLYAGVGSWGHWEGTEGGLYLLHYKFVCRWVIAFTLFFSTLGRIANSNNMNKSESDQEDNDDINDNDWSYGSEKKGVWGSGDTWEKLGWNGKTVVEYTLP